MMNADGFDDCYDDDEDDDYPGDGLTEQEAGELLSELLNGGSIEDVCDDEISVRTFRDAGLLTSNEGLVVRIGGAEFQLSIVRSR